MNVGGTDMKFIKKNKSVFMLVFIYSISHWLLCVISGQWWDDWFLWTNSLEAIKPKFQEAGSPWETYILFSVMWIPNWGYRIVVFLLFLVTGLVFYGTLIKMDFFSEEEAFWITAISMTVPVNDARVTLICYGNSLSLCLFMIAFFLVTRMTGVNGNKRLILRLLSLMCLLFSYNAQSLLIFTGLIWLYLFYIIWKQNEEEKLLKKLLMFLRSYCDYLAIPFGFWIMKNILFKPYGEYDGYNSVSSCRLIKGILSSPISMIKTGLNIGETYYSYVMKIGGGISLVVFATVVAICFIAKKKLVKNSLEEENDIKHNIIMFVVGCIVYFAGLFAYVVVRDGAVIRNTGVVGRDALLAGFGIGIMALFFVKLTIKKQVQNLVLILMIILGIFHFNYWYLNYQEDWYHQQEFAKAIEDNGGLSEDNTILCDFSFPSPCGGTRFYSLNGMSRMITGKKDKFYFYLQIGLDFNEYFKNSCYNAEDYDSSDTTIDGVMFINNVSIGHVRSLKMRFDEIFKPDYFSREIDTLTDVEYIRINKATSDKIYKAFENGELTSESLRNIVGSMRENDVIN